MPDSSGLPSDILRLIFDYHVGHYPTLCSLNLTSRAWHDLSLPALFHTVNLSSHNLGRQPEHECSIMPVVYADFASRFRPSDSRLIARQRALIKRLSKAPALCRHIMSLKWTIIWLDFDEEEYGEDLHDIDRKTWDVFTRMQNVTLLDLASLHRVGHDSYVRCNPSQLFPRVTDLRLSGWMHRGLVRAILSSIDASSLRSLALDHLLDEGALPDGAPMNSELAIEKNSHSVMVGGLRWDQDHNHEVVENELIRRQESGTAFIFPGPMWLPCHLLLNQPLDSLTTLRVKVVPYGSNLDLRSYWTMFKKTSLLTAHSKSTLRRLTIVLSEPYGLTDEALRQPGLCGTGRARARSQQPWPQKLAASLLRRLLLMLSSTEFECLEHVSFAGFDVLGKALPRVATVLRLVELDRMVNESRFPRESLVGSSAIDHRHLFKGHECEIPTLEGQLDLLAAS